MERLFEFGLQRCEAEEPHELDETKMNGYIEFVLQL